MGQIHFENGNGGRAEESGWTVGVNDSGLVIGLAQGTGSPIPAGEGLLTQIPWNGGEYSQLSGSVSIADIQVSGYFGSELSSDTGDPINIEPSLSLVGTKNLPSKHSLEAAYPNPFNPTTQIGYYLANTEYVTIDIYDLTGRRIRSLLNHNQGPGHRSVSWDGTNDLGQPVSAGMYIYTIQTGNFRQTRKMVLLK